MLVGLLFSNGEVDDEKVDDVSEATVGEGVARRSLMCVGMWAPMAKVVMWMRRWPWRDLGSVPLFLRFPGQQSFFRQI